MMRLTKRNVLLSVMLAGLGLFLAFCFAEPLFFWVLVGLIVCVLIGLTALDTIILFGLAVSQLANRVRFGARMTLDEFWEDNRIKKIDGVWRGAISVPVHVKADAEKVGASSDVDHASDGPAAEPKGA